MKKFLAILVMLALATVAMAEGEFPYATGQVEITESCGITLSSDSLLFDQVGTGAVSDETSINVKNQGSIDALVEIYGENWITDGYSFGVDNTKWSLNPQQDYYTGMTALSLSPGTTLFPSLANGQTSTTYFRMKVPLGQRAGSYTQKITFESSCDQI